ncbi:hypothetical protein VTJ83DRAFT_5699 [Remersonia thermophila]|uniref:C2H2-type domain-containing protein n=1 Tax=Remersonia thermophila TaxID=72144 RepID=A0ABR4D7K8_9PEZI
MTTFGLEVLLEDLIPEIAYSGEKGVRVVELLKIVRKYHLGVVGKELSTDGWTAADDAELERSLTEAEMASARWAWDWLRTQSQILINGDRRWNRLELSEVLALPEAETVDLEPAPAAPTAAEDAEKAKGKKAQTAKQTKDAQGGKGGKNSKAVKSGKDTKDTKDIKWEKLKTTLATRPRIHPTEDLVWQTLTRHGVDYKKVPALEWACLQGIASARAEGILQSDLRRLVNQDKRSLPKRTDSLAQKGYIAKRTVVVAKMKTSRLWLIDFAPPLVEADNPGLDLTPENLTKDLEPVPWHNRWTGSTIDMDALGRTVVGIVKAWKVIRYADLRAKLGISGKRWQMKTLAKNSQRLVDMGVFRYTAASFPGARKVFKDCLKFVREPTADEWEKFLATGKKTSKYSDHTKQREPKPNALALYQNAGGDGKKSGDTRSKVKRIFSGWTPEKPLAQTVFEVIRSAGPEGASNPQISAATIGYQHRRYLSSYLTKVADTQQPPHLKKFQVASQLVRTGKTSAYMYSAVGLTEPGTREEAAPAAEGSAAASPPTPADRYGFGAVRARAFAAEEDISLSNMSSLARKTKPSSKASKRRLLLPRIREERPVAAQPAVASVPAMAAEETSEQKDAAGSLEGEKTALEKAPEQPADLVAEQGVETTDSEPCLPRKDRAGDPSSGPENLEEVMKEPPAAPREDPPSTPAAADAEAPDAIKVPEITETPSAKDVTEAPETSAPAEEHNGPEAPEILAPEQLVLNVRYGTIIGKLQVHQSDRKITFLRSGRGLKKPVIIPIDAHLEDPVMQDVPNADGSEKGLVFTVGGAAGAETSPHVFVYGDEDQHRARWIQQEVIRLKDPNAEVPTADAGAEGGQAAAADAAPSPAGTKGKKPARGGRGNGKKKAAPAGAKPYVCSLCGGAWKNDIGLKYHLEKAQVPCNPNFDPASLLDRPRKRRRLSPPPPPPAPPAPANPEPAEDGIGGRRPRRAKAVAAQKPEKKRRVRRSVRTAIRAFQGPAGPFRGLAAADSQGVEEPEGWLLERPRGGVSRVLEPDAAGQPASWLKPFAAVGTRSPSAASAVRATKAASKIQPSTPTGTASFSVPAEALSQRLQPLESLPTAPATPAGSQQSAGGGADDRSSGGGLPDPPSSQLAMNPVLEAPRSEYPPPPGSMQDAQTSCGTEESTSQDGWYLVHKPLTRSTNYDRLSSEAKKRTAQAFDIINYLLDNNLGVFPGERALFYAMTKVFLKEFPNQMPPTWKNFVSALKAIETRKLATVHTHMVKTEKGRLQTCSLLIRTGVEPNGIIAARMKQKIREVYPAIFIPPAFSPNKEELALLQELDKKTTDNHLSKPNANGKKFRSRRKIEEIEVLNAHYYTNTAPAPKRDPLWIREFERNHEARSARSRPIDQESLGPVWKNAPKDAPADIYGDIPVDPSIMGGAMMTLPQRHEGAGPSVLEAVKAYGLLPPKPGPRHRRLSYPRPLSKLPRELGRVRNPGLSSLPRSFFGIDDGATTYQRVPPETVLLGPQGSIGDVKNIELDRSSVLESASPGSGLNHPQSFRENPEGTFTFDGWMPNQQGLAVQTGPFGVEEMDEHQKAGKIKSRDRADKEYARFCSIVDQCAAWEQSPAGWEAGESCRAVPGSRFIHLSLPASWASNKTIGVKWSEDTQYDLETLPYGDLDDDDHKAVPHVEYPLEMLMGLNEPFPKKRRLQNGTAASAAPPPPLPPPPSSSQRGRRGGRPSKVKLAAIKTMREHTAYPKSSEDLLWSADDDLDWSSENVRLAAFIVVTTLLGGVDRVVDWGLMLRLVPDQTISQLRHYWCALKKDRQSTIVSLTDKFRRAFLKAYEKGEVPPIDFDNVLAYDWKFLIKWTTKLDLQEQRTLPASREGLEQTATVANFRHDNRPWREAFYHPQRSIFNKFQDATCEPLALPVDEDAAVASDPKPDLEMVVAMAWTRALCVTPVEAYSAEAVLHRRNSLFPHRTKAEITELMVKGVDQLQKQGVISKSSSKWTNGRRWRFNTRVLDCLEKMAQQDKFAKAAEFKRELDRAFRSGGEAKRHRVTYITNDGMIMALLNLQANGRVRIETTGQPYVPMGHEPGNYETRKYTKKYMHFRLDVVPTERYLYDEADPGAGEDAALAGLRRAVRAAAPPTRGPGGAVPAWCDVFGKVDAERWLKYLSAVLITLASRGSMPVGELVQTLKPVIMAFEAELILEWLAGLGLMAQQVGGTVPAVMEWWWVVVGVQREGLLLC